jgi:hypothetical protein
VIDHQRSGERLPLAPPGDRSPAERIAPGRHQRSGSPAERIAPGRHQRSGSPAERKTFSDPFTSGADRKAPGGAEDVLRLPADRSGAERSGSDRHQAEQTTPILVVTIV